MQKMAKNKETEELIDKMFKAGAHYGYSKTRRHPSVSPYIYATKNKSDLINLEKTAELLEEAKKFIKSLGAQSKTILFVGTKPEAKAATKEVAESLNMPFVAERWIGGTLSNFPEIKKRITELDTYRKDSTTGKLEKYTKKERVMMAKKMEKLARYYSGLIDLKKAPDALFVIDAGSEHIAVTEANKAGIPVIALANSDTNIKKIDHPILGNDAGIPSIKFFTAAVGSAYKEGTATLPEKK